MKKGRVLLILAMLVCLGFAVFFLSGDTETGKTTFTENSTEEENGWYFLYERPLDQFESMRVTLPGESYLLKSDLAFYPSGELAGVYNALGQPVLAEGREDFRLAPAFFQTVMVLAQHLPVTGRYEGIDKDACGLLSPSAVIEINWTGGEKTELRIGDKTADGASCFLLFGEDPAVYTAPADLKTLMLGSLKEKHWLSGALSADADAAVQLALVQDETQWILKRTGTENGASGWEITSPFSHPGNAAGIGRLITGIAGLEAISYAGTMEKAEDAAFYGMDRAERLVLVLQDGTIRDIRIGADAGNGQVYACMDRGTDVYLVSREQLLFLESATPDYLLDPFVNLINAQDVRVLSVRAGKVKMTLENVEEAGEEYCRVNGETVSTARFSELYRAAAGILLDKPCMEKQPEQEPLLTLNYSLKDGAEITVTYEPYDDFYMLARTGNACFLTGRSRLQPLMKTLEEFRGRQ